MKDQFQRLHFKNTVVSEKMYTSAGKFLRKEGTLSILNTWVFYDFLETGKFIKKNFQKFQKKWIFIFSSGKQNNWEFWN